MREASNDHEALFSASIYRDFSKCKALISNGHDINQLDEYGDTVLIAAAEDRDDPAWIARLLELGADIDACNKEGDTALQLAQYMEHTEVAELLIASGATEIPGPSHREQAEDAYCDMMWKLRNRFLDDRMYVLEVARLTPLSAGLHPNPRTTPAKWSVITRRNVRGYPPTRTDDFDSYEEAVEYLKKVAPETPRVSLGKQCPAPPPSWDEFQDWLQDSNLQRMPY